MPCPPHSSKKDPYLNHPDTPTVSQEALMLHRANKMPHDTLYRDLPESAASHTTSAERYPAVGQALSPSVSACEDGGGGGGDDTRDKTSTPWARQRRTVSHEARRNLTLGDGVRDEHDDDEDDEEEEDETYRFGVDENENENENAHHPSPHSSHSLHIPHSAVQTSSSSSPINHHSHSPANSQSEHKSGYRSGGGADDKSSKSGHEWLIEGEKDDQGNTLEVGQGMRCEGCGEPQ